MSRRRNARRSSDLYQVDFVAALFSGFLLIWLVGIGDNDAAGVEGASPLLFEVSVRAIYAPKGGAGNRTWIAGLPEKASIVGCAHDALVAKLRELGRLAMSCTSSAVRGLQVPPGQSYKEMVEADARKSLADADSLISLGLQFDLFFDKDAKSPAPFAGLALLPLSQKDQPVSASSQVRQEAIGVASILLGRPAFLRVRSLRSVSTVRWSILNSAPNLEKLLPVGVSDYFFSEVNRPVFPDGREYEPPTFEFLVRVASEGASCFKALANASFVGDLNLADAPCP